VTRSERQELAVSKWIKAGCRGTCAWATGSGKTRVAIIAIKSFLTKNTGKNIKIIVPTEHLKIQWLLELDKYGLSLHTNVEIINSAVKKEERIDLLILDEAHRYGSDSFIEIFKIKHPKLILGLSATFHRLDGRHRIIEKYCPIIDTVTVKEALKNGWLSSYREYKVVVQVDDFHIYQQASQEFQDMFAIFNFDFNLAMKCVTNIVYRRYYGKTLGIASKDMDAISYTWQRALRKRKEFVMNHPDKILEARPFSKAITFSGTIKQAEKIGIGTVVHSGKTKKKNRLTIEEFSSMPTGVINSSKSLNEGVDIPGLNLAVILTNSSSPNEKIQRIGRVIRKEEDKLAEIFTLVIKGTIEEKWFENSSQYSSYIEITESELDEVLRGDFLEGPEHEGKEIDQLFRL
jgi:superfamily II DNA or RNA helicase